MMEMAHQPGTRKNLDSFDISAFSSQPDLLILSLNIASLPKHYDDLLILLSQSKYTPDIIALTEVRLCNGEEHTVSIDGYNSFFSLRNDKKPGGVGIYIKSNLVGKQLELSCQGAESLFIEIISKDTAQTLTISSIYRHPSDNKETFINGLEVGLF